jgi:hypothetical protein
MSNFFNKFLNLKKKVNHGDKNEKMAQEGIKINIKGQRVHQAVDNTNLNVSALDMDIREKGPPMLNMKTRMRVWGALSLAGVYFYLCYRLIIYRLKSDDLDLMEREVNEEFKLKTKLKEISTK